MLDARLLTKSNLRFNPSTGSEGASTCGVTVERLIAQSRTFEIEAESADEAHDLAEEEITNIDPADWDDHFEVADPEVIDVAELGHAPNDDEFDDDDTAD